MRPVRRHRQAERLGEMTDLHEHRHPPAVGHIGLRKRHAAGGDQLAKLGERVQILAGRDRQSALAHDPHVAGHVLGTGRLLEPHRIALGERARRPDGLVDAPAHVGVHHQRELGAEMRAHGPYALDVLAQRRSADLQLDRAEAAREVVVGLSQQRVDRQVEIDAAGVARHARIEPTQHAPERAFLATRAQVPQRDIDGRHRQRLGAPAAAVVQRPPHGLPDLLDTLGVASHEQRCEIARDQRVHRGAARADRIRVAHALGAVVVVEPNGDELEAADGAVRAVGERGGQRDQIVVGPHVADAHGPLF